MPVITREWLERELAGLIVQLHQTEGAISALQQLIQVLDQDDGVSLDQFEQTLPSGFTVEGISPAQNGDSHED